MDTNPKISIIIPTRNRSSFLHRAVEHAMRFKELDYEVIISNNASEDNTCETLKKISKKYKNLKIVTHDDLIPLADHWDKIISEHASGEYILLLSDDDVIDDVNYLNQAVSILDKYSQIEIVFAKYKAINISGDILSLYETQWKNIIHGEEMFQLYNTGKDLFIPLLTAVFRKSSWENVGGFKSEALSPELFLWLKLMFKGDLYFVDRFVAKYLIHDNNLSRLPDPLLQIRDIKMLDEFQLYLAKNFSEYNSLHEKKIDQLKRFILRRFHSRVIKNILFHGRFRGEWLKFFNFKYFIIDYLLKGLIFFIIGRSF